MGMCHSDGVSARGSRWLKKKFLKPVSPHIFPPELIAKSEECFLEIMKALSRVGFSNVALSSDCQSFCIRICWRSFDPCTFCFLSSTEHCAHSFWIEFVRANIPSQQIETKRRASSYFQERLTVQQALDLTPPCIWKVEATLWTLSCLKNIYRR